MQKLFMTTDAESLYLRLQKKLYSQEGAFRQIIIVPHEFVADKIYALLAEDGIATGFKVFELGAGIDYLVRLSRADEKKGKTFPAPMLLSLHLQFLIKELVFIDPLFATLKSYIIDVSEPILQERRIEEIADALSIDFLHYGVYGGDGLRKWLENITWQTILFKKAFDSWDYPLSAFSSLSLQKNHDLKIDVHLFGFSFIPWIYESFFEKIASIFDVHHYFLTPSQFYWGYCLSDNTTKYLTQEFIKKKVSESEIENFKSLENQENPFLANYAKALQRRYNYLLDKPFEKEEFFYENLAHSSLLEKLKIKLFYAQGPIEKESISDIDQSFQIHKCPSKRREIEVLAETLLSLIDKKKINPADILILAPNISDYLPYIRDLFTHQTPLDYEVYGLEIDKQSDFLSAFLALLCFLEGRFEKNEIINLLSFKAILQKLKFEKEDLKKIKRIIELLPVDFGYSKEHKKEILSKYHYDVTDEGAWLFALKKAALGLCIYPEVEEIRGEKEFYPLTVFGVDEGELFGTFCDFLEKLFYFRELFLRSPRGLSDWIKFFKDFSDIFFDLEFEKSDEGYQFFSKQLKTLEQLAIKIPNASFSFFHLRHLFEKTFSKKGACIRSRNKNSLRFSSLSSQMIYPTDVIVFLGMDEESFPKKQPSYPLREIPLTNMDPYPLLIEEQKQVIFDAMMNAKKALVISYCAYDESDGKIKELSYFFKEWLDYIERYFVYEKGELSKKLVLDHRGFFFHKDEITGPLKEGVYIQSSFDLATAFYSLKKEKRKFIPELYEMVKQNQKENNFERISTTQLSSFARNPFRSYMKDLLGIQITNQESTDQTQKEFKFSDLDKSQILKDLLCQKRNKTIEKEELEGRLPRGIYKEISKDNFLEEKKALFSNCKLLDVDTAEVYTFELHPLCTSFRLERKNHWILPALQVKKESGENLSIEGKIEGVTKRGLLCFSKTSLLDALRMWPTYLLFLLALEKNNLHEFETNLIFIKEGVVKTLPKGDHEESLRKYIAFFEKALGFPAPLFPSWIEAILTKTEDQQQEFIKKMFYQRSEPHFLDDYEKWFLDHMDLVSQETLQLSFGEQINSAFKNFLNWNQDQTQDG